MPGFSELLILALVVAIVFLVPRMTGSARRPQAPVSIPVVEISGRTRLTLALCALWLAVMAAIFEPWRGDDLSFVYYGLGPVVILWGANWVLKGFKDHA